MVSRLKKRNGVNGGVKFGSFFVKKLRIVTLSDNNYLSPFTDLVA